MTNVRELRTLLGPLERVDLERMLVILSGTAPEAFAIALNLVHELDPAPVPTPRPALVPLLGIPSRLDPCACICNGIWDDARAAYQRGWCGGCGHAGCGRL